MRQMILQVSVSCVRESEQDAQPRHNISILHEIPVYRHGEKAFFDRRQQRTRKLRQIRIQRRAYSFAFTAANVIRQRGTITKEVFASCVRSAALNTSV